MLFNILYGKDNVPSSIVSVFYTLFYNVKRQFALMFLAFPFLLYIFYKLFALWAAALIETRIDGVLIWVY